MLDLSSIPTPAVYVDVARVRANIARMAGTAAGAGVSLRPHAKTHKSPVIARWQLAQGASGICCAKLSEAEVFADAGIEDIRLPYPLHPVNASRLVALMDRARVSIIVDDLEVARGWSAAMTQAGRTLDVLVKVDVGFHRCGIDPDCPGAVDTVKQMARLPALRYRGLLSHAGHGYTAGSRDELEEIAAHEITTLTDLAGELRKSDIGSEEISVGATPTARFVSRQRGVTEMRPGNYVFCDRTQVCLGAARLDDCALGVVATVVSRPARGRAVFDSGSKTLSSDAVRGFGTPIGYGLVFPAIDATEPDEGIVIERLSEEHATVRLPEQCPLKPGDRVRIVPNHACVVANLADELLAVERFEVVDTLRVAARGRIW